MVPPLITLEEHFISTTSLSTFSGKYSEQLKHIPHLTSKLSSLSNLRLQDMDAGQIALQIISHGPFGNTASECRAANQQLHEATSAQPKRFKGFATLPMADPDAAGEELVFAVREFGFVGALIDNHTSEGIFYDGPAYRAFWSTVEELDVPIYLHPTWAPSATLSTTVPETSPSISEAAELSLGSSGWGWHSSVAIHILRLFAGGLFDEFPRLKIVIGHFGEMIPFMLGRIEELSPRWGKRERGFRRVWDENIWVTTSGVWSLDPMATILRNTKIERILYSVDYPFVSNERGLEWIKELESSGMVTREGLEGIAYKNAEKLLGVKAII